MTNSSELVTYSQPDANIAAVTLNRADTKNAQNKELLFQLDAALKRAAQDDSVKVIIIAAEGDDFSSGHDLHDLSSLTAYNNKTTTLWGGFDDPGHDGQFNSEQELYVGLCWRWRNLPKPTVVQVQGRCIAGGLMLVWPFDIVIASEDARFSDPVVAFGIPGHEYFTHVWELGPRKAREMLFCGSTFTADECRELGMVNHVVPREELSQFTLNIAKTITTRPMTGLRMTKMAINQSLDAQGQWTAIQSSVGYHQYAHAQMRLLHGIPVDPSGIKIPTRFTSQKST